MRKRYFFYSLALASALGASAKVPSAPTHDGETIEEADSVKRAKLRSSKTRTTENCVRKGIVVDAETGEPIIGASVFIKGTREGTVTNSRGEYTCQCPKGNEHFVISFVGKKSREVTAGDNLKILLYDDETQLKDVVVVAYGTQQKRNLTSSVASVTAKTLTESPVTSLEQALEGKMAGVQVTPATGAPGGAVVVNIRGTSSISAGNEPLYVVDGLPILSQDISQKGGYQGNSLSGIADINPNDIESVEVLKDASASALYGSRASNGVVLITTKQGRRGRTRVTLDSYIGFQDLWKSVDLLDANSHVSAYNEAIDNYNTSLGLSAADAAYKQHITANDAGADTDWLDAVTRTALQTSHQLSISGGNDRTLFYVSGGFYDQQGVIQKTEFKRYNLRTNLTHQLTSKLRIDANIALSSSDNIRSTGDGNIYSPWVNALKAAPDYAIYAADGSYNSVNSALYNPLELIDGQEQTSKKYRAIVNLKGEWKILPFLTYRIGLDGDYNIMHERGYFPATSIQGATSKGEVTDYRGFSFTQLIEHTLDFKKTFGDFDLGVLAGYSYQKTKIDNAYVGGINFLSPSLKYITSAGEINTGSSSLSEYALQSFFGRVNLSYAERYLLELSLRSDASSKFSPSKRVGYFPAASAGWRISDESWFGKSDVVSDLKLRASVGYTGNQEGIGYYEYHNIYSASGVKYDGNPGLSFASSKPNNDLTWEKTLQYGVGVDVSLLNHRIDVSLDWYKKDTHDLLLSHSINALSGYSSITDNVGSMTNTGIDLSITSHNLTGVLLWNTTFNLSWVKNKVTGLANGNDDIETGYCNLLRVGEPLAAFYLIEQTGIYQSKEEILAEPNGQAKWDSGIRPGDVKYNDVNADGVINDDDRIIAGTPFPKVYGSLANTLRWKGFDLLVDLQYSLGNKMYAGWKAGQSGLGNLGGNANGYAILKEDWDNRWTESNPSNEVPRAVASGTAFSNNTLDYTTRYLESADFLRIRNITLGYTLPVELTERIGISNLRLYATAANLYTFTSYDGFDPEVTVFPTRSTYRGYDMGSVPRLRSFVFGLNITF